MINYILIANTAQSTINYPALVGLMLLLVGGVFFVHYILSIRCVDGWKHEWAYHSWNEPDFRQVRRCRLCGAFQSRPDSGWSWGRDGLHVAGDDEL